MKRGNSKLILFVLMGIIFLPAIYFGLSVLTETKYSTPSNVYTSISTSTEFFVQHIQTPSSTKGVYMTSCVAGTPSWRNKMMDFIDRTELNSVVIDIKDYSGTISFPGSSVEESKGSGCQVRDMKAFVNELHNKNIYVIGRIAVFQDPLETKHHPEWAVKSKATGLVWKDKKGLSFIDVGARPYWDHIVTLAKDSYNLGFDEINFDYIRYPSDGNIKDMNFTWAKEGSSKADELESFFAYLHNNLKGTGMKISADLFGLTTIAYDDLGIGQVLEKALPYFDYVDPMVYPSHYASGSQGFAKPAEHPYDIVVRSMANARIRELMLYINTGISTSTVSKLRPWLQDFDLGASYGAPEVQSQIRATYDASLPSWLVWDAGNVYTQEAYLPEETHLTEKK